MKKNTLFLGTLLSLFIFFGVALGANFSDIAGHWAESDLLWAVNKGLLKGDDTNGEIKTLRPDDSVTRAELATILKRYDNLLNGVIESDTDVYKATIGEFTWVGRKSNKMYQVIKIDKEGNETVVYETPLGPYGDVQWNSSGNGAHLVITAINAGPETASYTEIAFKDGVETIRTYYEQYFGHENNLRFEFPGSPIYNVSLITTEGCEENAPVPKDGISPQVEFSGIEISSKDSVRTFELDHPETVACPILDGYFIAHEPENITTSPYGIGFDLPNGKHAWISNANGDGEISVSFY